MRKNGRFFGNLNRTGGGCFKPSHLHSGRASPNELHQTSQRICACVWDYDLGQWHNPLLFSMLHGLFLVIYSVEKVCPKNSAEKKTFKQHGESEGICWYCPSTSRSPAPAGLSKESRLHWLLSVGNISKLSGVPWFHRRTSLRKSFMQLAEVHRAEGIVVGTQIVHLIQTKSTEKNKMIQCTNTHLRRKVK